MFLMVFRELNEINYSGAKIPKIIKKKKIIKKEETLEELIIRFSYRMPLRDNKKNLALLKAIIKQESNFKVKATSICGARGLMQIMPYLGSFFGKSPEELYEVKVNLKIGVSHFKTQYNFFKNIKGIERIKMATAAYNCGRMYLLVAIKKLKKDNSVITWDNVKKYLKIIKYKGKRVDYKQVTNYTYRVIKYYQEYLKKEK